MRLPCVHPQPDATWSSHGRGIKLVYCGPHHADRSLAAAFSLPRAFHLEFLRHTRHPRSASTQHNGARCSHVEFFQNDVEAEFIFQAVGPLTPSLREDALRQLGLDEDVRYDHDRCPIAPQAGSDSRDCVVVLDAGVYCYRCAGRNVSYTDNLRPGFYPFSAVVGCEASQLDNLADGPVHWTHARLVLRHHFPNLAESILKQAYRRTLESRHGADDPRVWSVFDQDLDFVWGDGLWLDAASLQPTQVDNDAAGGLPFVQKLVQDREGGKRTAVNPVRRSQVKHRTPRGCPKATRARDRMPSRTSLTPAF
jgi:hypothetical protein